MSQIVTIPRVFGGTLILAITEIQQVPGVAIVTDSLIDQATISDVEVAHVTISDQA